MSILAPFAKIWYWILSLKEMAKIGGVSSKIQFWRNLDFGLIWGSCSCIPWD